MVSFAYPDQLEIIAEVAQSFAMDNGAFTAWKQGSPVDSRDYLEWVRKWNRHPGFAWCLIPDVIDGSEKDNDARIHEWANMTGGGHIESVPVWHLHESLSRLRRLARTNRMIALGSSGQWAHPGNDAWWDRINEAFPEICDEDGYPICKVHGLRMLNPEIFTRLPFASADSTNAPQNAGATRRFGMYAPSEAFQRANVIADRIEAHNSAARFEGPQETSVELFENLAEKS